MVIEGDASKLKGTKERGGWGTNYSTISAVSSVEGSLGGWDLSLICAGIGSGVIPNRRWHNDLTPEEKRWGPGSITAQSTYFLSCLFSNTLTDNLARHTGRSILVSALRKRAHMWVSYAEQKRWLLTVDWQKTHRRWRWCHQVLEGKD